MRKSINRENSCTFQHKEICFHLWYLQDKAQMHLQNYSKYLTCHCGMQTYSTFRISQFFKTCQTLHL